MSSSTFAFVLSVLIVLAPCLVLANNSGLVINEIAWMGTAISYNDEWIELYNNSEGSIGLEGWQLVGADGTPSIVLSGTIPVKGFFLLERTDDQTVPNITADLTYKGSLNNQGELLKLINSQGEIIDEVNCSDGWLAGDNTTKHTMERNAGGWQTSQEPGGTPKQTNSQVVEPEPEPEPPAESPADIQAGKGSEEPEDELPPAEPILTTTTDPNYGHPMSIVYPQGVFINEILASPEGADSQNEWIELFNSNDFEIELENWQIRDTIGAVKTYTFPVEIKIAGNGFLLLLRPQSNITLQNNGDGLELINPNGEITHQIAFPKAPRGQSYNRTTTGWQWSTSLTPNKQNIIALPEPPVIEKPKNQESPAAQDSKPEPAPAPTEQGIADITKSLPDKSNRLITILAGLIIAVASAIIVLVIKKRTGQEM